MSESVWNVRQFHKFSSKCINQNKQAFIMFSCNKTSEWLDTFPYHLKNKMINKGTGILEEMGFTYMA